MEIRITSVDGGHRAAISGEADADNCAELGTALLGPEIVGQLHVDLSQLGFLDSSAVSELLRVQKQLGQRDVSMTIVDTSPAVRRVLEITGLLDIFGIPTG